MGASFAANAARHVAKWTFELPLRISANILCFSEKSFTKKTIFIYHIMPAPLSSRSLVCTWYLFAASLVGLDQAVKYAIRVFIPLHDSVAITSFFNLVHILNSGAAFSFLAHAGGWQRYLLIGLGAAISAFLAFSLWRGVRDRLETMAYIGLIGGALGNVVDRLYIGAVVDYLDFHWLGWHWPAFNLADIFVVSGAILLLLGSAVKRTEPCSLQIERGKP